jgi:3-oxoacyl-[acyl-carrier-protein] synthase-1
MLAVIGMGMVSSLGLDVVTSCAAARAGINRIGVLDDMLIADEESGGAAPLVGHQVPLISPGMFGFSRLLQLAMSAIEDLRRNDPTAEERPVGLILVLGSRWHRTAWIDRRKKAPPDPPPPGDWAADEQALAAETQRLASAFLSTLIARARIAVPPAAQRIILGDQSGFVTALEQASTWLNQGVCETCWVGGIDSYLDPPTIKALTGLNLLRTPDNPVGLIPGEMGCFLSLKSSRRRRAGEALATIEAVALASGASKRTGEAPPTSEPLLQAMATAGGGQAMEMSVVNLNGDTARASEWGVALVRRKSQGLADGLPYWIPPLHFGEIGSATGPASIALLARGWARRYAPAGRALVCLMEEGPARGAIAVNGP